MAQKRNLGHQQLPHDQQRPGVETRGHIEEAKDAVLAGAAVVRVQHDEPKDNARQTHPASQQWVPDEPAQPATT